MMNDVSTGCRVAFDISLMTLEEGGYSFFLFFVTEMN